LGERQKRRTEKEKNEEKGKQIGFLSSHILSLTLTVSVSLFVLDKRRKKEQERVIEQEEEKGKERRKRKDGVFLSDLSSFLSLDLPSSHDRLII